MHRQRSTKNGRKRTEPLRREKGGVNHKAAMQRFLASFVCILFSISCLAVLALFYLQGFHVFGFHLEAGLMRWIGSVTIGALGGLMVVVYKAFFK
jgi:hypothetical protein